MMKDALPSPPTGRTLAFGISNLVPENLGTWERLDYA